MPPKDDAMMIQKGKFEWNLNTVVILFGFLTGIATWGYTWGQFSTELRRADVEFKTWTDKHELLHKERQIAITASEVRFDERLKTAEADLRKVENLGYRLTVVEQSALSLAKSIEELKTLISDQNADIRVIREVLAPGAARNPANRR